MLASEQQSYYRHCIWYALNTWRLADVLPSRLTDLDEGRAVGAFKATGIQP